jgi:hypothetical protein
MGHIKTKKKLFYEEKITRICIMHIRVIYAVVKKRIFPDGPFHMGTR